MIVNKNKRMKYYKMKYHKMKYLKPSCVCDYPCLGTMGRIDDRYVLYNDENIVIGCPIVYQMHYPDFTLVKTICNRYSVYLHIPEIGNWPAKKLAELCHNPQFQPTRIFRRYFANLMEIDL